MAHFYRWLQNAYPAGGFTVWISLTTYRCIFPVCRFNFDSKISAVHEFVPVRYDWERLAAEMGDEGLPPEFVETITSGWWTTCLEILPSRERQRGRF